MKYLLDTQVLLWAAAEPERLGPFATELTAGERLVSAASVWELAIKQALGKVSLGQSVADWIRRATAALALELVEVTTEHAAAIEALPPLHRDPFDRLLVVQARQLGADLVTADRQLASYGDWIKVI